MSKETIIIVIISLVAGGIIIIVVVVLLWRHKSKRGHNFKNNNKFLFSATDIEAVQLNLEPNGGAGLARRIKYSNRLSSCQTEKEYFTDLVPVDPEWEVDYDNIEFKGLLGEGAFGRVMMAVVHGLPSNPTEPIVSAVKMLKGLCLVFFIMLLTSFDLSDPSVCRFCTEECRIVLFNNSHQLYII